MAVKIAAFTKKPYAKPIIVTGATLAKNDVVLRTEIEGTVQSIPVVEGATVTKGDVIVQLDERDRKASLAEAKASLKQRKVDFAVAESLRKKGLESDTNFSEFEAALEAAKAAVIRAEIDMNNTTITAPFDGVVEAIYVDVGDVVSENISVGEAASGAVARLVGHTPVVVRAHVPEHLIGSISLGYKGTAELADGRDVAGVIRYISAVSNPQTRTYITELEILEADGFIPSGMTAQLRIDTLAKELTYLPSSLLTLGKDGELGVLRYDDGTAAFAPITMVDADDNGVWVSGLEANETLITVGQGFVSDGDTIIGQQDE